MKFAARFLNTRSGEDVSYYVANLGTKTMFPQARKTLYYTVIRLQLTRVGPTLRGETLEEADAKAQIKNLRKSADWEKIDTPFE